MTTLLIILLSLFLLALVAAPLFVSRLNEPLPDLRDPVMVDLEEERDALLRAIHELDNRADLSEERRAQLRTRYEAKAARVLRPGGALLLSDPFYWRDGEAPEGDPRAAVRAVLEKQGLRVEEERDAIPWAWATYDRHWRVYFSFCLQARKR